MPLTLVQIGDLLRPIVQRQEQDRTVRDDEPAPESQEVTEVENDDAV